MWRRVARIIQGLSYEVSDLRLDDDNGSPQRGTVELWEHSFSFGATRRAEASRWQQAANQPRLCSVQYGV